MSIGIFAQSLCAQVSRSVIFYGFRAATIFNKSQQRFSTEFKSGDWDDHWYSTPGFSFVIPALVDLEVRLELLSYLNVQWIPRFNSSTKCATSHFKIVWEFLGIHDPRYIIMITRSCCREITPHHQWPISMPDCGYGILLFINLAFYIPDLMLLQMSNSCVTQNSAVLSKFLLEYSNRRLMLLVKSVFSCHWNMCTGLHLVFLKAFHTHIKICPNYFAKDSCWNFGFFLLGKFAAVQYIQFPYNIASTGCSDLRTRSVQIRIVSFSISFKLYWKQKYQDARHCSQGTTA